MEKLIVSSSPHVRAKLSTRRIMLEVSAALLPTAVAGVILFGWYALAVIVTCAASAVLSEYVFDLLAKKENTVFDGSALLTGLLLGLNLPATVKIWQCVVGAVFAVVVVKCLFGGLGCNFANPAITGRVFMLLAFTETVGRGDFPKNVDAVGGATPLPAIVNEEELPTLTDMFLGKCGGAIGEVSALALLIGGIYLIARRIIGWETPVVFVGTVFLLSFLKLGSAELALYEVLAGGLLLGAFFMATDYVTTPITRWGKVIFAFGCGLITFLIRFFGNYPEGVSFSILLMNILTPYIEKWTKPRVFGGDAA